MNNTAVIQLSLFEKSITTPVVSNSTDPSALEGLAWSYSRRGVSEQCPRRYYNLYYGANQRSAKHDPAKERLRFLKALGNRHTRTGELLHLTIRTYFRQARTGTLMKPDQLISFACRIFQADRSFSRTHPDGHASNNGKYPNVLLREYHYRQADADALCAEAEERLVQAIGAFATDERYAPFRQAGIDPASLIEHRFKLAGFVCPVNGIVDLAFRDTTGVTIVDWKSGASDTTGDESLQLAVYGMWALTHFPCTVDDLRICKIHLGSGTIVDFHIDPSIIAAARARIEQDIERLAVVHDYGQRGVADAFTPCLQPAVCHTCAFERECYDRD